MKKLAICMLMALSFFNCQSQNTLEKKEGESKKDTIQPQTNIQVHKEYDENGNLIRLDSTYTYFYSNIKNDSILERDIYKKFKLGFDKQFTPLDSIFKNNFLKSSPFNHPNFYTDDFFKNNFKSHQKMIDKLLQQMDSLKNDFYKNQKNLKKL